MRDDNLLSSTALLLSAGHCVCKHTLKDSRIVCIYRVDDTPNYTTHTHKRPLWTKTRSFMKMDTDLDGGV